MASVGAGMTLFDDEFPGGGLEPVDGGLGGAGLGDGGGPFAGVTVGADQG